MSLLFRRPKVPADIEEREFECKRGELTIKGTEYRPRGENLPVAIVSHQFMAWQDAVRHYAVLLAEMGYAAYCFDFCGGSAAKNKSDGKTTDMSVLTEVLDLEAVISYVMTLPYVDSNRLVLMGCSQGGFVSALVAAKNKYPVEKLVLFYPALCIPDDARRGRMMLASFNPENPPEVLNCGVMRLGRRYVADVINMDAFEEIKAYDGRVLIVHGTKDNIVNLSYAERAIEAYRSKFQPDSVDNQKVRLRIIEGGTHIFDKKRDKIAKKHLCDFIRE